MIIIIARHNLKEKVHSYLGRLALGAAAATRSRHSRRLSHRVYGTHANTAIAHPPFTASRPSTHPSIDAVNSGNCNNDTTAVVSIPVPAKIP